MSRLPDLHALAIRTKNMRRLKHDGGRAWIKDSQLHEARKGANPTLQLAPDADSASALPDSLPAQAKALPETASPAAETEKE